MTTHLSREEGRKAPITIDLPWPHKDLSPNSRAHWAAKADQTKKHRSWGMWAARKFGPISADALAVSVTFSPPGHYAYDDDNLVSRCKAYLDGIADGLGVNDRSFRLGAPQRGSKIKHGNVRFEICPLDGWEAIGNAAERVVSAIPVPKRGAA